MTKEADRRAVSEGTHAFVGTLIDMAVLTGGGEIRIGALVLQENAVAIHDDVSHKTAAVGE